MDGPPQGTWAKDVREEKLDFALAVEVITAIIYCLCAWAAGIVFVLYVLQILTLPSPWR